MIALILDVYWYFFGKSASEVQDKLGAGFARWAETDYFSYRSGRAKRFTFKGGLRIGQPGE